MSHAPNWVSRKAQLRALARAKYRISVRFRHNPTPKNKEALEKAKNDLYRAMFGVGA